MITLGGFSSILISILNQLYWYRSYKLISNIENTRNECRELIDSLKKAWALVGQKLAHHSKYFALSCIDEQIYPCTHNYTSI